MPEQPFYKNCESCAHYLHTIASKEKKYCTRYPSHFEREPDDTCGEWICVRCWIPWDIVTPIEDNGIIRMYIIDHTQCPEVNLEPKEIITVMEEEDE